MTGFFFLRLVYVSTVDDASSECFVVSLGVNPDLLSLS